MAVNAQEPLSPITRGEVHLRRSDMASCHARIVFDLGSSDREELHHILELRDPQNIGESAGCGSFQGQARCPVCLPWRSRSRRCLITECGQTWVADQASDRFRSEKHPGPSPDVGPPLVGLTRCTRPPTSVCHVCQTLAHYSPFQNAVPRTTRQPFKLVS